MSIVCPVLAPICNVILEPEPLKVELRKLMVPYCESAVAVDASLITVFAAVIALSSVASVALGKVPVPLVLLNSDSLVIAVAMLPLVTCEL